MSNKNELVKEAANWIKTAIEFSAMMGLNAIDFNSELSASLYLNIRDAMFHFKAMYEAEDEECIYRNYCNLKEHIIRGEKDAIISYAQEVIERIMDIVDSMDYLRFSESDKKALQKLLHEIKNTILLIRLSGIDEYNKLSKSLTDVWRELANNTVKIKEIFNNQGLTFFI